MAITSKILHRAKIANNCPECYNSNGLEFTFIQKMNSNWIFTQIDPKLNATLYCHTCSSDIYPINWTEDIERVYNYQLKIAEVEKESFKLKLWGFVLIGVLFLALIALVMFLLI